MLWLIHDHGVGSSTVTPEGMILMLLYRHVWIFLIFPVARHIAARNLTTLRWMEVDVYV
jgi:hypothetical protein